MRTASAESPVRIGGASKTFTATLVLQLVGEGKLSLDTVERWLPGVLRGGGNDGRKITLRHILQHSSGLPQTFDLPGGESAAESKSTATTRHLAPWRRHRGRQARGHRDRQWKR